MATNAISQTDLGRDDLENGKVPATVLNCRNRDAPRGGQRHHADKPPRLTATYAVRNQKCSARLHRRATSRKKARALWRHLISLPE